VSNALHALARSKLVDYEPYHMVTLTDRGQQAAMAVRHRHAELKSFVVDVLGLSDDEADSAACRLEHSVGPAVLRRLTDLAEFIRQNHGKDKAPWRERFIEFCQGRDAAAEAAANDHVTDAVAEVRTAAAEKVTTLADVPLGGTARVVKVRGTKRVVRQLAEAGLTNEAVVSVVNASAAGDAVEVQVRGYTFPVGRQDARGIEVEEL
jgi:DtxR family Mn-dependent transcriptional regulator